MTVTPFYLPPNDHRPKKLILNTAMRTTPIATTLGGSTFPPLPIYYLLCDF